MHELYMLALPRLDIMVRYSISRARLRVVLQLVSIGLQISPASREDAQTAQETELHILGT